MVNLQKLQSPRKSTHSFDGLDHSGSFRLLQATPNELRAQYELFKQLSQGTTPCDDWYTTIQNQLTMCNYKAEIESVLQHDIFLFGLSDQTFISKIISEESPDVTAATIRQKLKKLEAGRATAKYIKGASTIGKDPTVECVNQV